MFPWVAKSAGTMFSRLALRRICKFLFKKKLGKFILGDIDLDQFDVQLSSGTVQLKDLAIDVDHLNDKLGKSAAVKVREGSIGSLLLKIHWNGKTCQLQAEVDELELVLTSSGDDVVCCDSTTCDSNQDGHSTNYVDKDDAVHNPTASSISVHQGVKIIAEMVKWLLTNLHVKVKNIIVALDPHLQTDDKKKVSLRNAVLRIAELECGTCLSGDNDASNGGKVGDFLGIEMLTSFLKFRGAIFELLLVDDTENQTSGPSIQCPKTTPVLIGAHGGFSGNVKVSIPWKNGSLDIRKMDVDVGLDPVGVELQPWTIKWLLSVWKKLEKYEKNDRTGHTANDIAQSSSGYHSFSSALASDSVVYDRLVHNRVLHVGSAMHTDLILENSHLIPDWMPCPVGKSQNDGIDEADLGASIDQFFECFDGMRNSQSLGSSGMWNWTCSVFSAITAASSLASGSLCIPTEQQHAETNVKITLAEVSAVLSFVDENDMAMHGPLSDDSKLHYLLSRWQDVVVAVQVSPKDCKIDATVKHIDLSDYFSGENNEFNNNSNAQTSIIQRLQDDVKSSLPPSSFYALPEDPFSFFSTQCYASRMRFEHKDTVKARLLETYGSTRFQYGMNSRSSNGRSAGSSTFSIELPPFIFWVNLNLLKKLLDLLEETRTCFWLNNAESSGLSEDISREHDTTAHGDVIRSLHGNIFLPNARIVVCFPSDKKESYRCYASWDQFIAVDFSSASNLKMEKARWAADGHKSSRKKYSTSDSRSLCLNIANIDVYIVSSNLKNHDTGIANSLKCRRFTTDRVLSLASIANHNSVISLLWHGDAETGPWIVKNAKLLATSDDFGSKTRIAKTGYEFSYATHRRDTEDLHSQMRREMILSSELLLHVSLRYVEVALGNHQLICLFNLLNEAMGALASKDEDSKYEIKETPESQFSVLVECHSMEITIKYDTVDCTESSLQRELPGSWHKFKLNVQTFEWLSVYSLGGVNGANFLWISHGEGRLWGSITGLPDEELLLVSCSNSSMGRGDGEGSNRLSCRLAGSDILHLFDPKNLHNFTSTTLKCCTIVAPGARLDWLDKIISFFSIQSATTEDAAGSTLCDDTSQDSAPGGSSFIFSLIDGGLSYEPHRKKQMVGVESSTPEPCCNSMENENCEPLVTSLLAASSLKLSSSTADGTSERVFSIRMQDLGLLLHVVSMGEKTDYSVEHLRKLGYVKVAMESLVEAVLRTNCGSDLHWELDCSRSHITINTCHDTTLGLMRLCSQLQQRFAPDMEESALHLQNRWNDVQQVLQRKFNAESSVTSGIFPSDSVIKQVDSGAISDAGVTGLMDKICEDAFTDDCGDPLGGCDAEVTVSLHGSQGVTHDKKYMEKIPVVISQSFHATGLDCQTALVLQNAELIDSYCLSDLRSLSELNLSNRFSDGVRKSRSVNMGSQDAGGDGSGWYGNTPLELMEEHIADTDGWAALEQLLETTCPSGNPANSKKSDKVKGLVTLSNLTVRWRMHAGSDWKEMGRAALHSAGICGRDGTSCMELLLSDMKIQYDVFPDGNISLSRIRLSVKDFYLHDRSRNAPWKLVMGYYDSKKHPRKSSSNAFKLDLESIRPNPSTPLEEYRLRIAILPLLLHLHQSQLDFLTTFFLGNLPPVGVTDPSNVVPTRHYDSRSYPVTEEALLPFFQKFDLWPVTIRVDYQPTHVDLAALSGGKYVELVNLVPWKGVELKLKHVQAAGVYGWKNISEIIIGEWLEDISQNQIHKLLKGLPTIKSLVSVGSGAKKLVTLPVKNYRKNNRLVKGVQRGTIAFLRSISVEALGLGVHLAAGAHDILFHAESIVSRIQPSPPSLVGGEMKNISRSDKPRDALHGLQQAYENLSDGLGRSASALVHTPIKTYQRGGSTAALVSAIRGAPAAAIAPASAAAQAVHCALAGVRNSLNPEDESLRK